MSAKAAAPKHRKTYVDMLLIEAPLTIKDKQGQTKILKKTYCHVSSLSQEITTSSGSSNHPTWNDDCTFTLDDEYEEIVVELFEKKKHGSKILLGLAVLCANNFPSGKPNDIWLDVQPPPSCDSKYVVTGQIHVILYAGRHAKNMMLREYGTPQKDIPIRLNPGDLILCHNSDLIRATVHISTRSQWDHVAMVIKTKEHDQLLLFEATLDGVEAYLLNTALKFYRQNSKIAIRRANFARTDEFMEKLYEFVDEVTGRPYKQDWIQLVRASYNANEEDDLSSLFCSQLIAAAYQRLGLISKEVCSNNFVPSDFAHNFQGELKAARMSNVRKIPSISKRKQIELKDQYKGEESVGSVCFSVSDDQIHNVKFTDTAMKRDQKLNLYTVYIINVTTHAGWRWILFKRYNDFVTLDKELQKYFTNIPSLPRKYLVAKFDEQTIQRRRVALQHYFKCLVRSPAVFCSILYQFLSTGRKGVSLDPNREIKAKKKKITQKPKKTQKKNPPESPTTRRKKSKQSNLSASSRELSSDSGDKKIHRRSSSSRKNTVGEYTSPIRKKALLSASDIGPATPSPKTRLKKKRVPRAMSESRTKNEKSNISHSTSSSNSWTKAIVMEKSPSWTKVSAPSAGEQSRSASALLTRTISPSPTQNAPLSRSLPVERNKNLVDLSKMFGQKFCIRNKEEDSPTRAKFLETHKFQRTSATFYLNKFDVNEDQFDLSEESENSDEDFEVPEDIMREENIAKLSDIDGLDLKSLGIDDVDLAEFDLNDDCLDDLTESGLDVDQLLDEFASH